MKFISQSIEDVILIEPTIHGDDRGYFAETFRKDLLENFLGYEVDFIQDNESKSSKGVLRGLHYQLPPFSQAKLVRVTEGSVMDVVVDIRKSSSTFGQFVAVHLTEENKKQLFVPHGFAHGFIVLSDKATFMYKVDNHYSEKHERGIIYSDKELNIDWIISPDKMHVSGKDQIQPTLATSTDLSE